MPPQQDPQFPPGTVDDLMDDARRLRLPATPRLVTDWVTRGLLDSPQRRSAGQGLGSFKAVFSSNQRQLFSALLQHRDQALRLSWLSSIPLVLWVYWGDEYVPTRQARKALTTSLESRQQPKGRAAQKAAEFVQGISHLDASPTSVNRLRRLFTEAMTKGRISDPEDFNRTYLKVFDPHKTGRRILPPGVDIGISVTPTQLVAASIRQEHAVTAFQDTKADRVTDEHLERVRIELQRSLMEYGQLNPLYAALSGQRLVDVVAHHEFQKLTNGVV